MANQTVQQLYDQLMSSINAGGSSGASAADAANASYAKLMHSAGAQTPAASTASAVANGTDAGSSNSPLGAQRTYNPISGDLTRYGMGPEHLFFTYSPVPAAPAAQQATNTPLSDAFYQTNDIGSGGGGGDGGGGGLAGGGIAGYAKGGAVRSPTPGRADRVTSKVPEGTYIVPADVVSGLGQGNTEAGVRLLDLLVKKVGVSPSARTHREVPVMLSGGEYKVSPQTVVAFGQGSHKKGADALDRLVAMVRSNAVRHAVTTQPPRR